MEVRQNVARFDRAMTDIGIIRAWPEYPITSLDPSPSWHLALLPQLLPILPFISLLCRPLLHPPLPQTRPDTLRRTPNLAGTPTSICLDHCHLPPPELPPNTPQSPLRSFTSLRRLLHTPPPCSALSHAHLDPWSRVAAGSPQQKFCYRTRHPGPRAHQIDLHALRELGDRRLSRMSSVDHRPEGRRSSNPDPGGQDRSSRSHAPGRHGL